MSNDPAQEAIDMLPDPVAQNNAQGRRPHGFICLHVDDLFKAGDKVLQTKCLPIFVRLGRQNDIMLVPQYKKIIIRKDHTSLIIKCLQ